jgi:DNA-binding NarL/FixJ family response regulator
MPFPTLLVEDHPMMRKTLCEFLSTVDQVNLVHAAPTAEEALIVCSQDTSIRLAVVDVSLPGMNGIDLVAKVRHLYPNIHCLILSGHQELTYVKKALQQGAAGYVIKGDPVELQEAIDHVAQGQTYLSTAIRQKLAALDSETAPPS